MVEEQCREQLDRRARESSLKEFIFALPPSVHSWDRVQRRREEGGTENRTSLCLQLYSSVSHVAPEKNKTNTHTVTRAFICIDLNSGRQEHRLIKTHKQELRQTDRQVLSWRQWTVLVQVSPDG